MPKEFSRTKRVGEQIQRELAVLLQKELDDPRVGMVTVSAVDVAPDFSHAKVYVTALDAEYDHKSVAEALNKAAGFLRGRLGQRLSIRVIPQLRFMYDESVDQGNRLAALIDAAVASDRKSHQ
jgi:ribosome-binding factor A